MKIFGKGGAFEWAGIPCIVWTGVLVLALNHLAYPFLAARCPWLRPVPLPSEYWTALGWIICGLFGKKVGDKFAPQQPKMPGSAKALDPEDEDGNRDQPRA